MRILLLLVLTCTSTLAASLPFVWEAAEIGVINYNLYGILGTITNRLGTTDSTNITVNITPNGSWKFQATAVYPEGESAPSNVVPAFVQPAPAPSIFQPITTKVGSTYTVTVSWSAAIHDYYVTNYNVKLGNMTLTTTSTSATFNGVPNGHYVITVAAVNMTGEGIPGERVLNIVGSPPKNLRVNQ